MSALARARAVRNAAARALEHGLTPAARALLTQAAHTAHAAAEAGHRVDEIHSSTEGPDMRKKPPTPEAKRLLDEAARDYAEAAPKRQAAFHGLADRHAQDQQIQTSEDRKNTNR